MPEHAPAPSPPPAPVLRRAGAEDLAPLAVVLAQAFHADPVMDWLMPDEVTRARRLQRFFAIELGRFALVRGEVWTTSDVAGAALILPPGAWRTPLRATLMEGRAFGRRVVKAARLGAAIERRHPRERHHYVRDVGVRPALHGKGIGSALLRPTLERCDAEGLPAYLEASSERNAALYARLGFRLIGELRVAGSPPLRLMRRTPQTAGVAA